MLFEIELTEGLKVHIEADDVQFVLEQKDPLSAKAKTMICMRSYDFKRDQFVVFIVPFTDAIVAEKVNKYKSQKIFNTQNLN